MERRIHEYKGYSGEVFMSQVLLNGQHKTLPGQWFHAAEDLTMPWPFVYVHHRQRLNSGKGREIGLLGAAGGEVWGCQSKWIEQAPVGIAVLEQLIEQGEAVRAEMTPVILRLWLFAYAGLTAEAEAFARQHDIL